MEQRSLQEKSDHELMELACRDNREAFEALGRAGTGDIGGHAPGTPGDAAGCGDVLMDEPTEAHKRTGRDVDVQGCFKMEQIIVKDCIDFSSAGT